jgi:hypothetical protein|tara:strand:+ start:714 stop:1091 length:378 start_codon:yes stop_codon:yes gene_type:complete
MTIKQNGGIFGRNPSFGNVTVDKQTFSQGSDITIASGEITPTNSFHRLDTESAAATDDLDTINGGEIGQIIILKPAFGSRTIVVKDNTGNIQTAGGTDFTMDDARDVIILIYDGNNWIEISSVQT